jgi:hypothetical protein
MKHSAEPILADKKMSAYHPNQTYDELWSEMEKY